MNDDPNSNTPELPVYGEESDATYTIEVISAMAGIDSRTVLRYQQSGFIQPLTLSGTENAPLFDDECLRMLRRIEHLRTACAVNDTGIRLILDLLRDVEMLRNERRAARR